jgi:prepilin-type N-terminal cleavage/methylation domain-containing protein
MRTATLMKMALVLKVIRAFTLMECLVSMVLISLVLVGLGSVFLGGKKWMGHRRYQVTAAQIAKVFLDPLQMDVRQDNWGTATNCLSSIGENCSSYGSHAPIDGITYSAGYVISSPPVDGGNLRRVQLTVSWNEPSP